jgi:hypothetical protein
LKSLGDKPYKNPEYSNDFFKTSTVVPPIFGRINQKFEKKDIIVGIPNELTWKYKVERE